MEVLLLAVRPVVVIVAVVNGVFADLDIVVDMHDGSFHIDPVHRKCRTAAMAISLRNLESIPRTRQNSIWHIRAVVDR